MGAGASTQEAEALQGRALAMSSALNAFSEAGSAKGKKDAFSIAAAAFNEPPSQEADRPIGMALAQMRYHAGKQLADDRSDGDHRSRLEHAIGHFAAVLADPCCTAANFPELWAATHNSLGIVFLRRIEGRHADNVERAIEHFNAALRVYTPESDRQRCAATRTNLALALQTREGGDPDENLRQSIAAYEEAAGLYDKESHPRQWAKAQNAIAMARLQQDRLKGAEDDSKKATPRTVASRTQGHKDTSDAAITQLQASLEVLDPQQFPMEAGRGRVNLGNAMRLQGDLRGAEKMFKSALEAFGETQLPEQWASTQRLLAALLAEQHGWLAAMRHWEASLRVLDERSHPGQFSEVQASLGDAAFQLSDFAHAADCYRFALRTITPASAPEAWGAVNSNLASVLLELGEVAEAQKHLASALDAFTSETFPVQHLHTSYMLALAAEQQVEHPAASATMMKAAEAAIGTAYDLRTESKVSALFDCAIRCCLQQGQVVRAVELADQFKGAQLRSRVRETLPVGAEDEAVQELQRLRQLADESPSRDHVQRLDHFVATSIADVDPTYARLVLGGALPYSDLLACAGQAAVHWWWGHSEAVALIFGAAVVAPVAWKVPLPLDEVREAVKTANAAKFMAAPLQRLAEVLGVEEWLACVPQGVTQLSIVAHGPLAKVPFHALPIAGGRVLWDRFPDGVRYASTASLLRASEQRHLSRRPLAQAAVTLYQVEEDLLSLHSLFGDAHSTVGELGPRSLLQQAACVSYGDGEKVALEAVTGLRTPNCCLAVLGAHAPRGVVDALHVAGATGVLAFAWAPNPSVQRRFSRAFKAALLDRRDPGRALYEAANALRDSGHSDARDWAAVWQWGPDLRFSGEMVDRWRSDAPPAALPPSSPARQQQQQQQQQPDKDREASRRTPEWAAEQAVLAAEHLTAGRVEFAIKHYRRALKVYTRQHHPRQRAEVQYNVAAAYRLTGDLERSISQYELCLDVFSPDSDEWAMVQTNLGLVYLARTQGEHRENVERAISKFEQALRRFGQETHPESWSRLQHNLAAAYRAREDGEKRENVGLAVQYLRNALTEREPGTAHWAASSAELADAFVELARIEEASGSLDDAELARESANRHVEDALSFYTEDNDLFLGRRQEVLKRRASLEGLS